MFTLQRCFFQRVYNQMIQSYLGGPKRKNGIKHAGEKMIVFFCI